METNDDLKEPEKLSVRGHYACVAIKEFLQKEKAEYTGGCKVFYSPTEWKERGEPYGKESELVVVYDGGEHRPYFTYSEGKPELIEKMVKVLEELGLYFEECEGWYGAIYRK